MTDLGVYDLNQANMTQVAGLLLELLRKRSFPFTKTVGLEDIILDLIEANSKNLAGNEGRGEQSRKMEQDLFLMTLSEHLNPDVPEVRYY